LIPIEEKAMTSDPKKRQKKLEKKKARRKEKHHELAREKSLGMVARLQQAMTAPVLHCWVSGPLFDQGMGQVILSRLLPDGTVAVAVFLVDMYCLGIKNAFGRIMSRYEYDAKMRSPRTLAESESLEPAAARKLVEGAVAYAHDIGFAPHPDYQKARILFGDINPNESAEEFEYGFQGKPHFIAGPHDNPARCKSILTTLERTCGQGNFHFTMPIPGGAAPRLLEDDSGGW
jgi:hypothetical protein